MKLNFILYLYTITNADKSDVFLMLKTTLAIMLHCNELLRGSEYVQGKYHVCTYVLRDCDFTDVYI